ncbi:MAG TPA: hypothetical protein VJ961_06810, partial [Mariprofundaceae bacterium]|nr:hypothetical protein [Mariprofundaceae bacterium]
MNIPFIRILLFSALLLALSTPAAWAGNQHIKAQIRQVQQERLHLKAVRKRLESRLGKLGQQLHRLDSALVRARKEAVEAEKAVRKTDARLADLTDRQGALERHIKRLKRRMAQEAAAAYQRDGRQPGLADILQGVSMAAIPHHQYMAARLMA